MVEKRIDQCTIRIACRRVDNHAGGLVHHDQIRVFKHDIERDVLRLRFGFRFRNIDGQGRPVKCQVQVWKTTNFPSKMEKLIKNNFIINFIFFVMCMF